MSINAKDVMALRQKTGAGMMDCKKALTEANGDFDAAIKILREKGISKAAKRAEREANEGRVAIVLNDDHTAGAMIQLSSETDFVARNEEFAELAKEFAGAAISLGDKADDKGIIPSESFATDKITDLAGKIGENLSLARAAYISTTDGYVDSYAHSGDLSGDLIQLGILVQLEGEGARSDAAKELSHDLALQIAALSPQYVNRDEVPADVIEAEKEVYKTQMLNEGKPENIIDKIATGKLNKFFEEVCLLDQPYVKEQKQKVSDRVAEAVKAAEKPIEVVRFIRFKVGEGA